MHTSTLAVSAPTQADADRWRFEEALEIDDASQRRATMERLLLLGYPRQSASFARAIRLSRLDDALWMLKNGWEAPSTAMRIAVETRNVPAQEFLLMAGAPFDPQELCAITTRIHDHVGMSIWARMQPPNASVLYSALEHANYSVLHKYFRFLCPASPREIRAHGLQTRRLRAGGARTQQSRVWTEDAIVRAICEGVSCVLEWVSGYNQLLLKSIATLEAIDKAPANVMNWYATRAPQILRKRKTRLDRLKQLMRNSADTA